MGAPPAWRYRISDLTPADDRGRREHGGLSPTLLELILGEGLSGKTVLDVGCGTGRLALALAPHAGRVMGIDWAPDAIAAAEARAQAAGLTQLRFVVADAEKTDYVALLGGAPDLVVANLCMSDAIIARAAEALPPGGVLAFSAFHRDQWIETGVPSRFAYTEAGMEAALSAAGFLPESLALEREVVRFADQPEAEAFCRGMGRLWEKWQQDGRWQGYTRYLAGGGRALTMRSHLIVKARRA